MMGRAMLFAVLSLLVGLLPADSHAQTSTLIAVDHEPLPGDGPGDNLVFSVRRNATYVMSLLFDKAEAATHRMTEEGELVLVARTPAGPEPRAVALARDGDYAVVVNSSANELGVFAIGQGGELRESHRASSGGVNPYDVAVAHDDVVVVANRDSHQINTHRIDRRGRLIALDVEITGLEPHVVAVSSRGLVVAVDRTARNGNALEADGRADSQPADLVVAVANQTGRTVSLYTLGRDGHLTPAGTLTLDNMTPRTLSWQGRNLYVALDLPFPQEDLIRRFRVRRNGEIVQHEDTRAGAFLTDIEATEDGVFAVTINQNNLADPSDDRDEVRVYRREPTGLVLDAAAQTPTVPPGFKQISTRRVGRAAGKGVRHVTVTEYQGDWLRWFVYDPGER